MSSVTEDHSVSKGLERDLQRSATSDTRVDTNNPVANKQEPRQKRPRLLNCPGDTSGPVYKGSTTTTPSLEESNCRGTKGYQSMLTDSNTDQFQDLQLKSEVKALKVENTSLNDELNLKNNLIEKLQAENTSLNEQIREKLQMEKILLKLSQDFNTLEIENQQLKNQLLKLQNEQTATEDLNTLQIKNKRLDEQVHHAKLFCLAEPDTYGKNEEYEIILDKYPKFCFIMTDIISLVPYLIERRIITTDQAANLRSCPTPSMQVLVLLGDYIVGPVRGGSVYVLHELLDIMEKHGLKHTQELATEIKYQLKNTKEGDEQYVEKLANLIRQLQRNDLEKDAKEHIQYKIEELGQLIDRLTHPSPGAYEPSKAVHKLVPPLKEIQYEAVNDYIAEQDDEISCNKGDTILGSSLKSEDSRIIGTVKRTGEQGKIPSKYVHELTS